MITAVNLGDDADTVGAVTGQLAGSIWGWSIIRTRGIGWAWIIHGVQDLVIFLAIAAAP